MLSDFSVSPNAPLMGLGIQQGQSVAHPFQYPAVFTFQHELILGYALDNNYDWTQSCHLQFVDPGAQLPVLTAAFIGV